VEVDESKRSAELRQLTDRVKELELALGESKAHESELRHALAAKEEAFRKLRQKKGYEGHKFPQEAPAAAPPLDPEIRLRQRIDKLSELARNRPAPEESPVILAEEPSPDTTLVTKLSEAERQTRELEQELQRLESDWSTPPEPAVQPPSEEAEPVPEADNVILLPNRTRDLKTGTSSAS
jgi:hypothetical protein